MQQHRSSGSEERKGRDLSTAGKDNLAAGKW